MNITLLLFGICIIVGILEVSAMCKISSDTDKINDQLCKYLGDKDAEV